MGVLLIALSPGDLSACPQDERARALFDDGLDAAERGDLKAALAKFESAYELCPTYKTLRNIAASHVELGHFDVALRVDDDIVARYWATMNAEQRRKVEEERRELETKIATIKVEGCQGILFVDGHERSKLPSGEPVYVLPGKHTLRLDVPDQLPFTQTVWLQARDVFTPPPLSFCPNGRVIEAFFGGLLGPSIGARPEENIATGFITGARIGFHAPGSVSLDIAMGYFKVESTFDMTTAVPIPGWGEYTTHNDVYVYGPFVGGAIGYEYGLGKYLSARARATVGILGAYTMNRISAETVEIVNTSKGPAPLSLEVSSPDTKLVSTPFFMMPELGVTLRSGPVYVGASVGVLAIFAEGPKLPFHSFQLTRPNACQRRSLYRMYCMPGFEESTENRVDHGHGDFALFMPQVFVGIAD